MKLLGVCAALFWALTVRGQDGRLLSQVPVVYSDSLKAQRIRAAPSYRQVFDQTETLAITYLSGGLRIQGYVMQPKAPGTYPCVVFCRGGHEDFSKLEIPYTAVLADIARHGYVVIASQLRGTPGSEGKDEFGGADTLDVLNCWQPSAICRKPIPAASASTASVGVA